LPRDPYFAWFDYWLKGEPTGIMDEPAVFYSARAWVDDREAYIPADWRYAERWPPPEARPRRLSTCALTAVSLSMGRVDRRAPIVTTRVGPSRPRVGAIC